MSIPGTGWARRVTIATLNDFRTLLRTGTERAAETQVDSEVASNEAPEEGPAASVQGTADREVRDVSTLFAGISIEVPAEFHSRYSRVRPAGPITTPSSTTAPPPPVPIRRWFKQMSAADAQRPLGQNTNPTGHVTLVKAGHPIQQATWFRHELFAGQRWTEFASSRGSRERATITFRLQIGGIELGNIELDVTYTPSFEAQQANRTTVVHWGQVMNGRLRENDYTNYYITIERSEAGEFLMVIDTSPAGQFEG